MESENTVKEPPREEPEEQVRRSGRFGLGRMDKYVRYTVFVVVVGLIYIWNSHYAEDQIRREEKLKKELADAEAEYKTINARLSGLTRRYAIEEKIDTLLGLKNWSRPPYKIEVEGE